MDGELASSAVTEATGQSPTAQGGDTPKSVAVAWVDAVMDRGTLEAAWPLTDPTLRLVLSQYWIWSHRDQPVVGSQEEWDGLARALAASPSEHPLWHRFAADRVRRWREFWQGFSSRTWSVRDEPEPLGVGLEVVTFVETGGPPLPARRFAMRDTPAGWLVAGLDGSALYQPGWPPSRT